MFRSRAHILPPLLLLTFLFFILLCLTLSAQQKHIADNLLRLHIVANSNTQQDQAVKLAVRDTLLTHYGPILAACNNRKEALATARRLTPLFCRTASEELRRHGFLYPVTVEISPQRFPTKHYGPLALPGGRYLSLTLRIGAGAGENWWCVMYPPLCLTRDAVEADPKTLDRLKQSLTPAEYALLTQPETVSVQIRFKITELLGSFR